MCIWPGEHSCLPGRPGETGWTRETLGLPGRYDRFVEYLCIFVLGLNTGNEKILYSPSNQTDVNSMEECIFHDSSVPENEKLQTLNSVESWQTILKVAKEKKFEIVLQFSKTVPKEEFPLLRYHKKCRRIFVNVNKRKVSVKYMGITSDGVIAKEASYRASCYRNYTWSDQIYWSDSSLWTEIMWNKLWGKLYKFIEE